MNNLFYYFDLGILSIVRGLNHMWIAGSKLVRSPSLIRVSPRIKIVLYKRLALMLQTDMPIASALYLVGEEAESRQVRKITESLATDVTTGLKLSNALQKFESTIGQFSINIVRIGEATGTLALNLEYLATELKKRHELRKQILGALIYPAIIILATLGIVVFLLVYIFPKIIPIFLSLDAELPLSTKILLQVSEFLRGYGWWIFGGVILGSIGVSFLQKNNRVHYLTQYLLLRLPVFGKLGRYYVIANTCRTLGLMLKHEVRIADALHIATSSCENVIYQIALRDATDEVITGKTLASQLRKNGFLWPPLVRQMVQAGEATGNLPNTFMYLSEIYESDVREWTKNLTTLLEPALMLLMGLCVGFIAISIITPIYGITANLHQ